MFEKYFIYEFKPLKYVLAVNSTMEIHEGDLDSFTIQQLNETAAGLLSQLK